MVKQITIMGTVYEVILGADPAEDKALENLFGYCSSSDKKIVIVDLSKLPDWDDDSDTSKRRQTNETLRHEIIHAFLHESGLHSSSLHYSNGWATNEEMVDWFAIQYPKIKHIYKLLDCEE